MTIAPADAKFGGVLVGGLPSADQQTISSMALLFDRIYVPFNPTVTQEVIEKAVEQFRGIRAIETRFFYADFKTTDFRMKEGSPLSMDQIANVGSYIGSGKGASTEEAIHDLFHRTAITLAVILHFYEQAISYMPLFSEIVYADIFDDGRPFNLQCLEDGTWKATTKGIALPVGDANSLDSLIEKNYFPIVTSPSQFSGHNIAVGTKALASLLAMKSITLLLPEVGQLNPYEVLEARNKLSDNLAHFWAGMLRLSKNVKSGIKSDANATDIIFGAQELVDSEILPAIIELKKQIQAEKKSLFFRLVGPIRSLVKLGIGVSMSNPHAITLAALDAGKVVSSEILKHVEALNSDEKRRMFSFLLELSKIKKPKVEKAEDLPFAFISVSKT
jgi:hypothetical protein